MSKAASRKGAKKMLKVRGGLTLVRFAHLSRKDAKTNIKIKGGLTQRRKVRKGFKVER